MSEVMTIHKLNPERKRIWVAALRSGKFRQTVGKLADAAGYCCYGVACVLSGVRKEFNITRDRYLFGEPESNNQRWEHMPPSVSAWLGIPPNDYNGGRLLIPALDTDREELLSHVVNLDGARYYYADNLNDAQFTFEEIATLIEERL